VSWVVAPYPEYRESGVEWLGPVPQHWDVIRIGHLSQVKRGASPRPIDDRKYFDDEGEYAWTRIADVTASDVYLTESPQRLSTLGSSLSVKLEPGELFLSIAATVGKPCITAIRACIHDGFVYFPDLRIPPKFLFYVFAAGQAYKGLGKMGTQLNLNTETVAFIKVGIGSVQELAKIVHFLDCETARIDALIEKQQQLIALLQEKRQAVISHAVTKGLNPDAPMRDSGVEWLGNVPAHWEVVPLKHHTCVFEQGWSPQCDQRPAGADEWGVLKVGCVNGGVFRCDENKSLPEALEPRREYRVRPGDLLISRANTRELVGSAAVVLGEYPKLLLCDKLYRLRFLPRIEPRFISHYLGTSLVRKQIELEASGASDSMQNIGQSTIKQLPTPTPPLDEAKEIVRILESRLLMLDAVNLKAEQQIAFLSERRTALISAAVTGKIDVRNWTPPSTNGSAEVA
jgi:type I restriction enzyme S subunit